MTELEKDICNLRSGLKSVESVSHKDAWCLFFVCFARVESTVLFIFPSFSSVSLFTGVRLPETASTGTRRQVCVCGESVHRCGEFQLLRCGRLSHGGKRTGKFVGFLFV